MFPHRTIHFSILTSHFSLLLLLLSATLPLMAQNVYVQTGSTEQGYAVSNISRITFPSGTMVVATADGQSASYAIASVTRLYFGEGSAIASVAAPAVSWNPASRTLTVEAPAGTLVTLYTLGGQRVQREVVTLARSQWDLGSLPTGTYIVEANGQTAKIVR